MSKPKKPGAKPVAATANRQARHQLPARVDDHMLGLLRREADADRRKLAQMVVVLLEEALRARGRWADAPKKENLP